MYILYTMLAYMITLPYIIKTRSMYVCTMYVCMYVYNKLSGPNKGENIAN